jgi:hypothetical protein
MSTPWSYFWPGLISGLLSGLFTGVFVGAILVYFETKVNQRHTKDQYEFELSLFQQRLHIMLERPDVSNFESPVSSLPTSVDKAMDLIRISTIGLWQKYLIQLHRKFFQLLTDFREAYTSFLMAAGALEQHLKTAVRKHNSTKKFPASDDQFLALYYVGKVLSVPDEELLPWVALNAQKDVQKEYHILAKNPELKALAAPFAKTRKRLIQTSIDLHNYLHDASL